MRILVISDDHWHPAVTPRAGFAPLEAEGLAVDWIENAADWSAEKMQSYPLVVLIKSNNVSSTDTSKWMTREAEQAFADYVRQGRGLLAIHSGTASYCEMGILRGLLGGVFTHHPKQCPVTCEPKAGHPLTAGAETFTVMDEHYMMEMDDPNVDLFLTTSSEHGTQPGGWTRLEGKGRVCVITPGHNTEVWLQPSFQAMLRNALAWCAGQS
jgi:uncharacterized protein